MPNYTSNYKLTKPTPNELYNIDIQNNNMDNVDTNLKKASDVANEANSRSKTNESNLEALKTFQEDPFEETGKVVQVDLFQDAPLNVVSRIEPIQEGSGDPYPGGGGKNKASRVYNLDNTSVYGSALLVDAELKPNTEYVLSFMGTTGNQYYTNEQLFTRAIYPVITEERQYVYVTTRDAIDKNNYEHYEAGRGWIILKNAKDNAANNFYDVQIEEGTTPSEYKPYSNIRPISGHTGAKLVRCGKNIFPHIEPTTSNGVTLTVNADGSYSLDGTCTAAAGNPVIFFYYGHLELHGEYTLSANNAVADDSVQLRLAYNNVTQMNLPCKSVNGKGTTTFNNVTVNQFGIRVEGGRTYNNYIVKPQLEKGSEATTFEPYQGETFSASFGQTVYGGTLDWGKGVLTIDRTMVTLNGTENYVRFGDTVNYPHLFVIADEFSLVGVQLPHENNVSSHYRSHRDKFDESCFYLEQSGVRPYINDIRFTKTDELKTFIEAQYAAGTPVQICYKLANPITIQLTPQEISALAGCNTLYSDCGETIVSGRKDIIWLTHSLIKRIEALEAQVAGL